MTINTETIRDAAEVLDTLTSTLAVDHPLRVEATSRAKSCVSGLYSAADAMDAQAAEIARLTAAQAWRPIETAPKDGSSVILRSRGGHIADGYWLQAAFNGCGAWIWPYVHSEPTHWMPLPAAPDALSGESNSGESNG